jgi:hypothetical protein
MTIDQLEQGNKILEKIAKLERMKEAITDDQIFKKTPSILDEVVLEAGKKAMIEAVDEEIDFFKHKLGEL